MRTHNRYLRRLGTLIAAGALTLGTATTATATTHTTATPSADPAQPAQRGAGNGIASITFDDGKIGQYRNARPVLDAAGIKATFFIISDGLAWGTATNMSATEVRQLVADGHEIGNHTTTHADLTGLSASAISAQFANANAAIQNAVGVRPTTCAYPYGRSNDTVRAEAAKYFSACRGTASGVNAPSPARYDLRVYYVTTSTTAAQVREAATAAKGSGAWIVFVFHEVGTVDSSDDVTTQSFTTEIEAIRGTGISIRTVSAAANSTS